VKFAPVKQNIKKVSPRLNVPQLNKKTDRFHPDEIKATKISSRWNKGNKDSIGQVGQAG
jgi:hypothetical protein